jgi:5-methylcytosine-specific restriction enzyme B
MARYSEYPTQPVYEAAACLLDRCFQGNGSLIRDNSELWTLENLESIHKVFVATPDEGDRSFIEKFEDQIKPAGTDIIRLAAEILAVYFLFPSNVGEARKRELVGLVLGWAGDELPTEGILTSALAQGVGSGGQGYNTRRPYEIAFLIEFAISWKRLQEEQRETATADPWKFMEIVDGIDGADTKQGRHILLHLLFPDSFERIASREHKRRIVASFSPLLGNEDPEDTDRRLLAIRGKLAELLGREELDFYWSPLVEVWNDSGDSGEGAAPMDALRHKRQVVLYGPPGTGKTYRAKRIADRLIRTALLSKLGPKDYFEKAKDGGIDSDIAIRTHRLQLHPAYGYEDFIRGLHIDGSGATEYRLGYLPRLVEKMAGDDQNIPHVLILDELNRTDLSRTLGECFSLLENRDEEIELPGQDASGSPMTLRIPANLYIVGTMNLIDQSVEQMDFALRRRFLWVLCPFDGEALVAAAQHLWEAGENRISWERVGGDFVKLATAAAALNREIHRSPLLGSQYEIGHTYLLDAVSFLRDDVEGRRPHTFLWDRRGKAKRPVEQTWELSLKPLLQEYLSGLDAKSRESEINRLAAVFLSVPPEAD